MHHCLRTALRAPAFVTQARVTVFKKPIQNLCSASGDANNLPRLPVPQLDDTIKKYIESVRPFLTPEEFKATQVKLHTFGKQEGTGEKLQKILLDRAKNKENWLEEWWVENAYMKFRSPVVFWSSPGLVFPKQNFKDNDDMVKYSAKIITAAVDYKVKIIKKGIPQEKMGKNLLDMSQYDKVFGTCRIPNCNADCIEFNPCTHHIIIIHNNHFFKLDVLNKDNCPLYGVEEIEKHLKTVLQESKEKALAVGILTSDSRDPWSCNYELLKKIPKNNEILDTIAKSLFTLSLDECFQRKDTTGSVDDEMTMSGLLTVHGGGSKFNGGNRWFDKTIQFTVDSVGRNGLTYEHSPAEGQPIAVMMDHIVKYVSTKDAPSSPSNETSNGGAGACGPEKLEFDLTDEIKSAIKAASQSLDDLVNDIEMECFKFTGYGKEFIKQQKLSPDSYIQMMLQYAFYRLHNVPGAHYESAATRMFLNGRTETIRSCSCDSVKFAALMLDPQASGVEKIQALKTAVNSHKNYTNQALQGLGVDRHLLGLKLAAIENKIELPDIYNDVSYTKSLHMRISTSQVASHCDGFMVYGPIVNDGYACCYNPRPNDINFGTSAFKSCKETSAKKWKESIIQSLNDMKKLLEETPAAKL